MKTILLSAVLLFSLSSLAQANEMKLELLLGYVHNSDGLVFQVFSGGCTGKDSFIVQTTNQELGIKNDQRFQILNQIQSSHGIHFLITGQY